MNDNSPPTTLLCLVSEQRMQNLLPLFQQGNRFQQVVLLASGQDGITNPRFAQIARELQDALSDRVKWRLWPTPVSPMIPAETEIECRRIIEAYGGPWRLAINFTGGTKPMSIGAYNAGTACGAQLLYVDTQAGQILVYEQGALRSQPFSLDPLPVPVILAAHGKPVNERKTAGKQPLPYEWEISAEIYNRRPESFSALIKLQEALRQKKSPPDQESDKFIKAAGATGAEWVLEALVQAGQAHFQDDRCWLSPFGVRYLDGSWLEQYVVLALQRDGRFPPPALAYNLMLSGIENEIDVACTRNGKLAIIECKTGSVQGSAGMNFLNRLRALKESLAGTFGKSFLVISHHHTQLSAEFQARAREYVSRIICVEDLGSVEQIIDQEMTSRSR